jgi:DNA-binding transcriptional LysR family regulator
MSAAAAELGVSPAVVSKRLATLERRAGQRLIHRTTRRLAPTDEGLALLPHVERVLEALAAAEARLAQGAEAPQGLLRVSTPISFGRLHVAPVAAVLVERHRGLDIELLLDDRLVDLVDARIDVAVRIGQPRDSSAVLHRLADSYRILVAAPAYLDRRGRPTHPDDLTAHDGLRWDSATTPWRLEGPGGAVVEVATRSRLRANSGDVVQDWTLTGQGVLLKSEADVAAELRAGRLERVLPDWASAPAPIYALTPSRRQTPAKVRVFLAAMAEALAAI